MRKINELFPTPISPAVAMVRKASGVTMAPRIDSTESGTAVRSDFRRTAAHCTGDAMETDPEDNTTVEQ